MRLLYIIPILAIIFGIRTRPVYPLEILANAAETIENKANIDSSTTSSLPIIIRITDNDKLIITIPRSWISDDTPLPKSTQTPTITPTNTPVSTSTPTPFLSQPTIRPTITSDTVVLTWDYDYRSSIDGFRLHRGPIPGLYDSLVADLPADATKHTVNIWTSIRYYALRAYKGVKESTYSNVIQVNPSE